MSTIKSSFMAALIAVPLTVTMNAHASKTLNPKVEGRTFHINCDRDFPNGKPSYSFIKRLDKHLGHSHLKPIPKSQERSAVLNYRQSHRKIDQKLIKPAINKCEM